MLLKWTFVVLHIITAAAWFGLGLRLAGQARRVLELDGDAQALYDAADPDVVRKWLLEHQATIDAAGERVFDVRLNGRRVIDGLDLAGQFGRYRAVRRQFEVRVAEGETLTLSLEAEEGNPLLNAIHLTRRP